MKLDTLEVSEVVVSIMGDYNSKAQGASKP